MTPEEIQKLLDEQRALIMAEVDTRIAAAIKAERARLALLPTVELLKSNRISQEKRARLEADEKRLRAIVPENEWPENWGKDGK